MPPPATSLTKRGWSLLGPIKTMARIDVPRDSATVTADTVTVAGIAWAQHTGIATVEVALFMVSVIGYVPAELSVN